MKCGKAALAVSVLLSLVTVVLTENQPKVKRQIVFPDDDDEEGTLGRPTPSHEVPRGGHPCWTPSSGLGQCVEYFRCPKLVGTRIDFNILRLYHCGYSGFDPKICCPMSRSSEPTRPPPRPVPPTPTTRKPPTRRPPPIINRPVPSTSEPAKETNTPAPDTPSTSEPTKETKRPRQLPEECGRSNATGVKILGGHEAEIGAWPWLAAIYFENRGLKTAECGGAIINPTHVVTAAHCIVDTEGKKVPAKEVSVRLGDHDLFSADDETDPVDIDVDKIIPHPRFDRRTYHNDIAILVLKRAAQFNQFVQPICLAYDPPMLTNNYVGRKAVVAGWGTTTYEGESSAKLREVHIPIWDETRCKEVYRNDVPLNGDYVCAGLASGGKDACQGDSGGPLMLAGPKSRFFLVGVVSFGKRCGLPNFPGVYTNVRNYLDWISENTA